MNKYMKAMNAELSYEELCSIKRSEIPKGRYYNYEKIRSVLLRKLQGEITDAYFQEWLIVACYMLNDSTYHDVSWMFDGWGFQTSFTRKDVLELLAGLKDLDYKIRHKNPIKQHKREKLQVIYLRFEHCNRTLDSSIYKAYFVDYARKRFDIRLIDDAFFEYDDRLLYCGIGDEESWEDEEGEIHDPPRTSSEEDLLMGYFFGESEEWVYDHSLTF